MLRTLGLVFIASLLALEAEAAKKKSFVYVHDNSTAGSIIGYEMAKDGTLEVLTPAITSVPNGTTPTGGLDTNSLAYSVKRKVLVVAAGDALFSFVVETTGALTAAPTNPLTADAAAGIAIVDSGKKTFLIAPAALTNEVLTFEVLADGSLVATPSTPGDSTTPSSVAATGKTAYVLSDSDEIDKFEIGAAGEVEDSTLPEKDVPTLVVGTVVEIARDGNTLYTVSNAEPFLGVVIRSGDSKELLPLAQYPVDPLATNPTGGLSVGDKLVAAFLAADDGTEDVQLFKPGKGGLLTALPEAGSTLIAPGVSAIALSPSGKQLLAASSAGAGLASYTIDTKTGALTLIETEVLPGTSLNVTDVIVVQR